MMSNAYTVAGSIALGDYVEAGSIVFLFTLADWLESRSGDKVQILLFSRDLS
jgi:Cd2+/Zn2+-exporting ATPase